MREACTPLAYERAIADNDGLMLVDYYKDGCAPCAMLGKSLDSIIGIRIIKAKLENLQPEYFESIGIRSVPTLRLYRGDEMIAERHGFASPTEIEAWVKEASE